MGMSRTRPKDKTMAPSKRALAALGLEPDFQLRGSGTSKIVYSARIAANGENVALISAPNEVYERENESFIRLGVDPPHPSLVLARAAHTAGAWTYFIVDLLVSDFFDLLTDGGALSEQNTLRFLEQMLSGVNFMHRRGVAHLDLKLENIGIDAAGNIRIFDFDHSMLAPLPAGFDRFECRRRRGTKSYMAPEMWRASDDAPCDPYAADIWSLGVVVFVLLFKYFPFEESRPLDRCFMAVRAAQAANQSTLATIVGTYACGADTLAGLSARTRNVLERMLTIVPEQRASLEEVVALLQHEEPFRCLLAEMEVESNGELAAPMPVPVPVKVPVAPPRVMRQNAEAFADWQGVSTD